MFKLISLSILEALIYKSLSILSFLPSELVLRPISNSPSPQRQRLQLNSRRLNKPPERHHPYNHTDDIHHVIPIPTNIAHPSALYTPILCSSAGARKSLCDEGSFEFWGEGVRGIRGDAGGNCKGVDEFEDEEAGEGTA